MKKRFFCIVLCFVILIGLISMFIFAFSENKTKDNNKLQIITTLYPDYDFASKIIGDKGEVQLLLGAGVEVHTYEPSVRDMKEISDSDMFIYTGDNMEPWAKTIVDSLNSDCIIVDASKNIDLIKSEEFVEEYSVLEEDKLDSHSEHEHDHEHGHSHEYDGHVWMNPKNAIIMIDTICAEIVKLDPENKAYYENNANEYKKEIEKLDNKIKEELNKNQIDTLVFGGEFAYAYFCEHYNIKVASCYTSCGEGSEPSVSRIKSIIDFINKNSISNVFYEELSEGTVASMISEETNATKVVFNTLQNVSNSDIEQGMNYITIMEENLSNICKKN